MFAVICYDIADQKRRVRVSKLLLSYGERVQESVYELFLDAAQWKRLQDRMQQLIAAEDRVCCYLLCANCRERIEATPGHPAALPPDRAVVVCSATPARKSAGKQIAQEITGKREKQTTRS